MPKRENFGPELEPRADRAPHEVSTATNSAIMLLENGISLWPRNVP